MLNPPRTTDNGHGHAQETTLASLVETVVDRNETTLRPSAGSEYGSDVPTIASPSPDRAAFDKPTRKQALDIHSVTTIPPEHDNRTLVLCFDGTGDQFDGDNSNIVQLLSLLKKDDSTQQMVYYQSGIGTYTSPQIATPIMSRVSKTLDAMFAWNLNAHVMDGYEFLMQNYKTGDRICIFGFSRGAYTARALAGMIHKVGLLPAYNYQQVPFAYKMYTRTDKVGWEQSNGFKKAFSIDVDIEFLGVWDTVDSVGFIPRRLPFTTSNTVVRNFRHAVALDERRAKFKANLWKRPTAAEAKLGLRSKPHPRQTNVMPVETFMKQFYKDDGEDEIMMSPLSELERVYSDSHLQPTNVEEVWFSGCHCDVGGGSVSNKSPHSLARISLRWMIRECFKTGTGIMFDADRLKGVGLDPMTLYPFVTPRPPPLPVGSSRILQMPSQSRFRQVLSSSFSKAKAPAQPVPQAGSINSSHIHEPSGELRVGTEEEEDLLDGLSPVYDQLEIKWYWWVLEVLPLSQYERSHKKWMSWFRSNFAHPRVIPNQDSDGVKVHRSVNVRMQMLYEGKNAKARKYSPRARFHVEPTWVD